jgi:hypothetical protein
MDTLTAGRGVAGLAATACLRVRDTTGEVVGSGFLVGPDLVATCAHVVAAAVGADPFAPLPPQAALDLDFPALANGPRSRSARVRRWVPIGDDGTGDVALLRLDAPAPAGSVMPPVRRVDRLWDHPFRVFGFPEGRWDGVWATGRIRGGQGTGWFQLQGTPGDQPIEGGFSGAPVWDDETGAVVGMTVAADRDPTVTTAYLLPVEQVLGLDPELLPSPYRGLEPFGEEHAEYFFGRDPEIARLATTLERSPLVAVAGPSGAGKSSLIRAGLLPRLRADGTRVVEIRPRPGTATAPAAVAGVLDLAAGPTVAPPEPSAPHVERIAAALTDPDTMHAAAAELAAAFAGASPGRCVLLVDQFEELAEAEPAAARDLLGGLAAVAAACGPGSAFRVVLTVRGIALDEVLTPDAAEVLGTGSVFVGPLNRARLREAIVRPAERAPGLAFEEGLVDRILDDAGSEPGQLPLVESLLAQLWARREGGSLTARGYADAGGVAGALAAHAEQVAAATLEEHGDAELLRGLCTRLTVAGHDGRFVRRPVRLDDLPAELRELVPVLTAGRLVVASGGPAEGAGGTVELAHQALVVHWPRLREWLAADREFLAWRTDLDAARDRWETAGRDDGALLRGGALDTATGWLERRPGEVAPVHTEYVRRSRARQRREVRRWRVAVAVLAVLVVAAGTLSVVAVTRGDRIAEQLATANAGSLGNEAIARAGRDPVLGAELALAAYQSDPDNPAARTALAERYAAFVATDAVVAGEPGGAPVLAVRAEGDLLLTGSEDGVTFVGDVLGPERTHWQVPEPAGVTRVQPNRDGSLVAVLSEDQALRLWTVGADAPQSELAAPGGPPVLTISFAPDGSRFGWVTAVAPSRFVAHVRELATGATASFPIELAAEPTGMHLTADADLAAVKTGEGDAERWSVRSLRRNSEVRALPPGAGSNGTLAVGCLEGEIGDVGEDGTPARIVVRELLTGVERHRIELPGTSCAGLVRYTLDGRYAVHPFGLTSEPPAAEMTRITDLASGVSYQFTAPTLDTSNWPADEAPVVTALPGPDGGLVALVAYGPTVLRVRAEREIQFDYASTFRTTRYDAAGGVLVVDDRSGPTADFATYDPATGRRIAAAPGLPTNYLGWFVGDALWTFGRSAAGTDIGRFELPGLTSSFHFTAPDDPESSGGGIVSDLHVHVVVTLADGLLTAWDGASGRQLGEPVRLGDTADEQEFSRQSSRIWARPDHGGQVFVMMPDGLELWDVPGARKLGEFDVPTGLSTQAASRGNTLVYLAEGELQTWNIEAQEPDGPAIAAPAITELLGFGPDGYLVSVDSLRGRVVFWDLGARGEAGSMRPSENGADELDHNLLTVNGVGGRMPVEFAVTAQRWRDHLCRILPGELSTAARNLLPPGADASSPCL